jgi:hypothetical protein
MIRTGAPAHLPQLGRRSSGALDGPVYRQHLRPSLQGGPGHRHGAVAIGVGLHHRDQLDTLADMSLERLDIKGDGVQVDLCPGDDSF